MGNEESMHEEFFEIATKLIPHGNDIKKTIHCPEESSYFEFLEDDSLLSGKEKEHIPSCSYCLVKLKLTANTILKCPPPTENELRLINAKSPIPPMVASKIVLKLINQSLYEIFNPLQVAEGFRSNTSDAVVINEKQKKFEFNLEIHPSSKSEHINFVVHLIKNRFKKALNFELWKDDVLLRAYTLNSGDKQPLTNWKLDNYILKVIAGEELKFDLNIVLL